MDVFCGVMLGGEAREYHGLEDVNRLDREVRSP
jgi:hypothetical protein